MIEVALTSTSRWTCAPSLLNRFPYLTSLTFVLIVTLQGNPASAFQPDQHQKITQEALVKLSFSDDALADVKANIVSVDHPYPFGEFSDGRAHCDDERLPECFKRVIEKRNEVLRLLKTKIPDGNRARKALGQALHTIQDFYSHSNWVHQPGPNKREINRDFGITAPTEKLGLDRATCAEAGIREGNHVLVKDGLTEITTGYFAIGGIPANKCNHGGLVYGGIAKDQSDKTFFAEASKIAKDATQIFVEQILHEVGNDEKAIKALLCVKMNNCYVNIPQY